MAIDKTQILADMADIIADDPVIVVVGDASFSGRRMTIRQTLKYSENGRFDGYSFTVFFAGSTPPADAWDVVSVDGADYRVIENEIGAVSSRLHLGKKLTRNMPTT